MYKEQESPLVDWWTGIVDGEVVMWGNYCEIEESSGGGSESYYDCLPYESVEIYL